jgi:DNA-binding MarR family transcriptional regulator
MPGGARDVTVGHELAMALRGAYLSMHRQTDACLAPLGVTANQFVLLALLAERDGVTQREVVERASSDPNTVGAMLAGLEGKGLVARTRHPTDGRAWSVTLTARGRRTFKKLWAESEPLRGRLVAGFRSGETEALLEFLRRISAAMGQADREPSRAAASRGKGERS